MPVAALLMLEFSITKQVARRDGRATAGQGFALAKDGNSMNLQELAGKIERRFSVTELNDLFFQLSIEYDDLPGSTRKDKIRELVQFCDRHDRLDELVNICKIIRPNETWEFTKSLISFQPSLKHNRLWIIGLVFVGVLVFALIFVFEVFPNIAPSIPPPASVSPLSRSSADCLQQYFADMDATRQMSIEVGDSAHDYYLSSENNSDQNLVGPFGIQLTQNGNMIGALTFLFFTDSHLFKITSVVDSNCQAVTNYSNATSAGDPNAIQNSETLNIQFAKDMFSLNFQFSGTDFFRFSLQQLQ